MPLSTSLSSSSTAPLASTSLSASSLPMVQAAVARRSGNVVAQLPPRATDRPGPAGSSLKVSVQRRSRSGLENSQTPTSARAASLGCGACARAAAQESASNAAISRRLSIIEVTLAFRSRWSLADQQYGSLPPNSGYFFTGVSGTGVSGPLPENQEMMLSATSVSIARRVATDADPTCGSSTT